ncbi:Asp23/Gls24 family envelope stress response protein [Nocardia sp. NPDC050406]|uniref:Asp23/Gls24 family envelope stress response protein n=1 Tax=Nocardia sp. NPDC050406 TaxID=3364318 RepID=UPI0037A52B91
MTALALDTAAALGRTTVSERAVRRIAARAATEVDGVAADVRVDAEVTADAAALRVGLPVRYPMPVARVAEACRGHLMARIAELAGLTVTGVEITVSAMPLENRSPASEPARRRVK